MRVGLCAALILCYLINSLCLISSCCLILLIFVSCPHSFNTGEAVEVDWSVFSKELDDLDIEDEDENANNNNNNDNNTQDDD